MKTMTKGYFNLKEKTKDLFDNDGYLLTGDIGMLKDEKLEIIDRKNNLIELYVNGRSEWIAVGNLEFEYLNESKLFHQMYLYGDRMSSHLIAVVVVKVDVSKEKVFKEIEMISKLKNLKKPSSVILETEEWTNENNMKTLTGKLKRKNLKEKYKLRFDEIIENLN
jgi:long-subunit acyl-CoA synthetase (AMP-forming)